MRIKENVWLDININKLNPIKGASYVELTDWNMRKNALFNNINKDEKCFMWSVLAALHPAVENTERVSKYNEYANELNFDGISFPINIQKGVPKFEKQSSISIIILTTEGNKKIIPLHVSNYKFKKEVD